MDKYEHRRRCLQALIASMGRGGISKVADAIDRNPSYVSRMLYPPEKSGYKRIGEELMDAITEAFPLWLSAIKTEGDGTQVMGFGATLTDAPRPNPPATGVIGNAEPAPDLAASKRVPVVGTAQLGDNGYWSELEHPTGFGDGCVIAWTNDENAYAIRCRGDSMRPRIKDGEFVVVAPNQPPIPGDEVLVKHVDGRVMVKTFLYERDERLHLVSVNEAHPSVSFPLADVELFSPVVAILKKAMWVAA